ncbi:hypothetical protein VTO42DRAFT_8717 [Malbranchea cinnamomea]
MGTLEPVLSSALVRGNSFELRGREAELREVPERDRAPLSMSSENTTVVNDEIKGGLKNSTIGHLLDKSGQAVSQHSIILGSMVTSLSQTLTGYEELHKDPAEICTRAGEHVREADRARRQEPGGDPGAGRVLGLLRQLLPRAREPARAAPLLRTHDGSTMKEWVAVEMRANSEMNEQLSVGSGGRPDGEPRAAGLGR